MIDATLVTTHLFRTTQQVTSFVYTVPTVLAGAVSDEIRFAIDNANEGKIIGVRFICTSTDFDISIRADGGISVPAIEEIYKGSNIYREYSEMDLGLYYCTPDQEDYLYMVLTNSDAVNATGVIDVEFLISCL